MKSNIARLSVFILEDDLALRDVLKRFVMQLGHQVVVASSLAEGQRLLKGPVDFCLVDYHLPDGHGSDFVRWGFARGFLTRAYCMTGLASPLEMDDALRAGCLEIIEKPFSLASLKERLNAAAGDIVACGCCLS